MSPLSFYRFGLVLTVAGNYTEWARVVPPPFVVHGDPAPALAALLARQRAYVECARLARPPRVLLLLDGVDLPAGALLLLERARVDFLHSPPVSAPLFPPLWAAWYDVPDRFSLPGLPC